MKCVCPRATVDNAGACAHLLAVMTDHHVWTRLNIFQAEKRHVRQQAVKNEAAVP